MQSNRFPAIALAVNTLVGGCGNGEPGASTNSVRDSAGVTVVESASPAWTQSTAWHADTLTPLLIGEGEPIERKPLDPVSVFRTEAGEIVVADGNQAGWHNLLVYDSDGRWLRTLGSKGEGPCEFRQVWWAAPYGTDSIAVFDMGRQLVHVLGREGGCGGSVQVPRLLEGTEPQRGGFVSQAYAVYPNGTLLMAPFGGLSNTRVEGPSAFTHNLVRVDRSGVVRQVLGEYEVASGYWDGQMTRQLHYGRYAVRALDGYDLVYGSGRSYEIQRFDSAGNLTRIMRRHAEPQRVTRHDQERAMSQAYVGGGGERGSGRVAERSLSQRIKQAKWAEVKPFYRDLLVDEGGHTWAEEYRLARLGFDTRGDEPANWSVFSRDGAWLGSITLPARFFMKAVYSDAVFGIWQDEDGVRTPRSYRLTKPE